jgi:hypothetical protein
MNDLQRVQVINLDEPLGEDDEFDVDDLFKDPEEDDDGSQPPEEDDLDGLPPTKRVSDRINAVRQKAEAAAEKKLNDFAISQGFKSFAEMEKASEKKIIKDAGFDPEEIEKLTDEIVNKRLAADPRLVRLAEYEKREQDNYLKAQLDNLSKLTGTKYRSIGEVPKEVTEMFEKTGSMETAFYAVYGKDIVTKGAARINNGDTSHLKSGGVGGGARTRPLNEEEKATYRKIMGDYITEEELSKKTIEIETKR